MLDVLLVVVYFKKLKRKTSQKDNKLLWTHLHLFIFHVNPTCFMVRVFAIQSTVSSPSALPTPHPYTRLSACSQSAPPSAPSKCPKCAKCPKCPLIPQNKHSKLKVLSKCLQYTPCFGPRNLGFFHGGFFGSVAANLDKTCLAKTQQRYYI